MILQATLSHYTNTTNKSQWSNLLEMQASHRSRRCPTGKRFQLGQTLAPKTQGHMFVTNGLICKMVNC